jgi:hypothetical protein
MRPLGRCIPDGIEPAAGLKNLSRYAGEVETRSDEGEGDRAGTLQRHTLAAHT